MGLPTGFQAVRSLSAETTACDGCDAEGPLAWPTFCDDGQWRCPGCVYALTDWDLAQGLPRMTTICYGGDDVSDWLLVALDAEPI